MKKLLILSILALLVSPAIASAQSGHEYSPLVEKTVNYKNWTLPNLMTDKPEDLRQLMAGKKLVMIVYFAPWCGNWKYEAPVAAKFYEKYKAQGFQVIGVSEYASRADVAELFWRGWSTVSGRHRIRIERRQAKDTSLRIPATHGRQTQLGFTMEYLSRTRQSQRHGRRAHGKSVGCEW